jgi:cell fate regulator YaaT (PSP1 superfamily)
MYEVIQIRLRDAGKISYYSTSGMKFKPGEYVIVEADRGLDYGQVISEVEVVLDSDIEEPLKKIVRKANPWDMHQIDKNKKKSKEVMETCAKKVQEHKLPMKLIDAEFAFEDNILLDGGRPHRFQEPRERPRKHIQDKDRAQADRRAR